MKVDSVMTACPTFATVDSPLRDVAQMMVDQDCGQIPVLGGANGQKPVGVVTDRDIVVRVIAGGRNPQELKAGDCMTSPVITVNKGDSLTECCEAMEREQIRRVLVLDADGNLCGIVAQADVARSGQTAKTAEVVKTISAPSDAR